ncbi:cadherin repeat domain-containing protein [Bradyrhizobium sp. AUGA SZCCT0042]|uniref:cadherin repeat domain-containing protein n=1 Tax=Bradyrhizobium sp. AUGA SZCCT0042 TaxID=2807651 RepID=UPI001BA45385|nr:cadherin repeat domain-containing protein [Bradyrhizobium sp. AUGA SZCCT0042]MBR1300821.1 cadherin domain-containing protein [Bradyrhizobium sp. AUGA SZCCT0042]
MANDLPPGSMPPPATGGTPPGVNPPPPGPGTPPGGPGTVIVGPGPPPPTANTPPSTATDVNAAANNVVEGAAVNTLVGVTARSTDAEGQTITYTLASDSSGGGFKIDAATGVVTVANPAKINFETAAGHAYTITVNSFDGFSTSSQSFTINVSDIAPSTPVDSNAGANTVAEGAAANTLVGITASSTDINGPGVTYSLSNSANGAFKIDAATGVVSVADPTKIDFESTAPGHVLNVTVVASDGTLSSSQNFAINVSDIALATPVDGNGAANSVAEGAANGSTVGLTAFAVDPNGPATTYSLIGDTSGGGFTIDATTGIVTVADGTKIDFETAAGHAYFVVVQASNGALNMAQTFMIGVTDVAPAAPTDSDAAANTVLEGVANGTVVGITAASSDINGGAVTYSLTGDTSGGGFTIDAATGIVTVADSSRIDFETSGGSYTVTAQASDGTLTSSQTFTIGVTNIAPSIPVDTNAGANSVIEGAANGSTVGITASSTDINGPGVVYSLADSAGGRFTIDAATGVVTVANSSAIDFESAPGNSYTIVARATDSGGLFSQQSYTIAVTDAAPSTPVDGDAAANTVAEGAANGSTVGVTASSTDVNGPGVTYSLIGDTSGGGFTIDATTGVVTVADATKIDFETSGASYTVVAQASDGTLASSQAFVIAVSDIAPSTPVDSNGAANQVVVGSAAGATVGVTASSTDVNGPGVTYTLIGDTSGGGFTVNAATGVVTVADPSKILLADPSYDITVDSSDGTLHSQQTFTVNVVTNLAPAIDSDGGGAVFAKSVAENTTAVTTVHATDPDAGPSPVTYSIVPGDDGGKFAIDANTGVVTFITAPDFENPTDTATSGNNTYVVTVRAFDGLSSDDQTITVTVTDVNDAPVITSSASINVNENQTAVATVTSSDQDSPAQTLTYSLAGGVDAGKFSIDPGTGVLTFQSAPNFEVPTDIGTDNNYDVIVRITDNGAPNLHTDQAVTVHVQDVNEAPNTNAIIATGNEDPAGPAYIPITITGTDVDSGDSVASFHISGLPGGAQGTLYSDAGLTTVVTEGADVAASGNAATLYFVPAANFNGAVTFNAAATDSHGLTDATAAVETINVTAVNDAPVNTGVPGPFTVMSGSTHTITGLSVSDIDANEAGVATDITTTLTSAGGGAVTIGAVGGGAAIGGNGTGTVTLTGSIAEINASLAGSVVYTAADGATGSSLTTLTIATNDHGHTGIPGAITDTDIIQVGVTPQVWFINGDQSAIDGAAPRGSQTNPFTDVTEFNGSSGPGVNDYIYVKAGTYTGPGINLKDGQTLLGDDQPLSLTDPFGGPAIVIETASGARPTINVTSAGDQGIDLAQNNTIHGINITTAAGTTGLDDGQGGGGNAVGSLTIDQMQISGAGQAVDIDQGGALNVTIDTLSSSGGAYGVQLGGALTGTFTGTTGTLSGHTTAEFDINGGTGNISYGGAIGNGTGLSASVASHTGGTIAFSGAVTDSNDAGGGISLTSNTGGTINFTGGMTLDTGASNAFVATGGGTVNVTGTNHLASSTGTALNITSTTIGASNVTFQDISSNGAVNGIVLNTTGTSGHLVVTGTGTTDGTGGTIQNTTGHAISLTNTQDVTLRNMNITGADGNGINGNTINGLVLSNLNISGSGDSTAGNGEGNIYLFELTGNASHVTTFDDLNVTNSYVHNVFIENTGGTLADLVVTDSTFSNNGASTFAGSQFVVNLASGGVAGTPTATVHATHNTFSGNLSTPSTFTATGFQGSSNDGTLNVHIGDGTAGGLNTFNTNNSGITLSSALAGNLNFDVNNNTVTNNRAVGIAINHFGTGTVTGFLQDTTIGTQGVAGSGAQIGNGLDLHDEAASGTMTLSVTNNIIQSVGGGGLGFEGIVAQVGVGAQNSASTFNLTLTGNTIRDIIDDRGLFVNNFNNAGLSVINANISDNTFSNANASGANTTARVGGAPGGSDHVNVTQASAAALAAANGLTASGAPGNTMRVDTNVFFSQPAPPSPPATPQMALNGQGPGSSDVLTMDALAPLLAVAIAQWAAAGASAAQIEQMQNAQIRIADLPNSGFLANSDEHGITIDSNGAGWGWFVDPTPANNSEFDTVTAPNQLTATSGSAAGRIDLLTVIQHELGHVIGLEHSDIAGLMNVVLDTGERRLPDTIDVALAPTTTLTPTISLGPVTPTASTGAAANPGNDTIDAGTGGGFLFGGGGADNFVFANVDVHAATAPPVTHVVDYSYAEGDRFDFSALTSQFHATGFSDGMIVRAVEDGSGQFATLQVNATNPFGPPAAPHWVSVAQIDGAHSGDALNVLIDSHSGVHLTQIHVGLLV